MQVVAPEAEYVPAAQAVHAPFFCVPSAEYVPAAHATPVPAHAPAVQTSAEVTALPSLHPVPLVAFGLLHVPVAPLHEPATWHWSLAAQTTAAPAQLPDVQTSVVVHKLPSLQGVPVLLLV